MSDAVDRLENEDRSWPNMGILPQSLAEPPSAEPEPEAEAEAEAEAEDVSIDEATPASANGAPAAEPARKEWLLIRLGHRLCGFRG